MAVYMGAGERVVSNRNSKRFLKGRVALAAAVSLTASGVWTACAEAARGGNDVKGAQVIAGAAQISNKGNTTTIRAIDKTIIKYDRFNIPKNGTVKFIQPSSSSKVLNRIDGAEPSRIEGHFTANGIVFFVNPAGVVFGPTAVVDVGQLYAGAGTIGDQDFLGGINKFSTSGGAMVNRGTVSADQVHLFGSQVVNRGTIVADGGIVTMSSGKDIYIGEEGGNIMVKVDGNAAKAGGAGVVNSGQINAGKGVVRMTGAGDIYSIAVNTSGMVKAKDVAIDAGKGAAVVGGKIDASDNTAGAVGGKVTVTGDKVALIGATVDASGAAGGGMVLVGGDVHGGGTTPTATATLVDATSTIKADASDAGNGGKVVVWSDKLTAFVGKISAKGGANSGDGGFVETSGKERLIYKGTIDVTAPHGTAGQVLLDPDSIVIQAANPDINGSAPGTDDITDVNDLSSAAFFGTETSVITAGAVEGLLTDGVTLTLAANTNIDVNAAISPALDHHGSLTLDAPTVNLNAKITLQGPGILAGGAGTSTVNVGAAGSIQNGVDVVASAGTVNVAAGTFSENVSVGKSISLLGAQNGVDARGRVAAESIINGQVTLTAPNTNLDGFKIQQSTTGAGVVASNAQGDHIVNNIITDNVFGLSLASDGSAQVLVKNNAFDTNTRAGSASGNAIYTDFTVSNVKVEANSFTGDTEGSVSFFGSAGNPQSNVQIVDNTMTDDGPISLETITNVTITGNTINNSTAHAIWIAGGVSNVTISNNFLENNGGAGVKFASVNIDPTPASNVTITNNSIQGNADGGIVINSGRYSGTLDATSNFWGSANGPADGGNTFNVGSQGDAIVNPGGVTVNYVRWLSSGADQNVGTAGFQPDAGSLFAPITLNGNFFSNIQAAHDAAASGDTAVLNTGTYTEDVTTTKNLTLQFSGDGTLASGGSLTLGGNLSVLGDGSISIGSTVNVGNHHFTVDTQTAAGTTINISGPIHATAGGIVSILGQQTVTLGAAIDPPTTLTLSSLDDVVVNAALQAIDTITISAGEDGTGGLTINGAGSLQATAAGGTLAITTGTTSGNVALGGSMTATGTSITTAGTVNQTGGTVTASTLGISSAGSVTMNQSNAVTTLAIAVSGVGNAISFSNGINPLTIGTVGSLNGISTTGANVLVNASSISITQPVSVGAATVRLVSGSGISESGSGTISAGALGVRATGNVTLLGNNSTSTFAANNNNIGSVVKYSSSGSITVGTVGGSGVFAPTGGVNALGDVLLKAGTSLALTQPISASAGTVRLVASNGGVSQNGSSPITAAALGVRASDDVLLDVAGNDVNTFAAFNSGAGKQIRFADADDLTIGSISADGANFAATSGVVTTGGPVAVSALSTLTINNDVSGSGGVSLSGVGVTQGAASTIDGGSGLVVIDAGGGAVNLAGIVTTTSNNVSAVQIANPSTTVLGDTVVLAGGLDIAGASGAVSQNTGTIIQVNRLSVSTGGAVTLDKNNHIDQVLAVSSSGGLTINDTLGGLLVTGPISNGAADAITIDTTGGALTIQTNLSGGALVLGGTNTGVSTGGGATITATTLRVDSLGSVTLTNANNVGTLAATSGGPLSFTNNAALIIGTASGLNGVNVGANALTISANGAITQTQPVTAGTASFTSTLAGAQINLGNTSNSITGAITFAPTGAGNVTLFNNTATNLAASTIGGNLTVTSTGAISDSGTLNVTGAASFETRSNAAANIVLDQPASTFGSVTARSRNATNSANGSGNISILESGTMDVTAIATGTGTITLEAAKINLGAADTVESLNSITLQPTLQAAPINLGTDVPLGFSFTAAQLLALKDGFSAITIGRSNGTGIVTVSSNVTFTDPVTIIGGSFVGGATLATNGANNLTLHATTGAIGTLVTPLDVLVGGTLNVTTDGTNANGNIFISSSGALALGGNITTDGGTAQTVNVSANGISITSSNGGTSNDNLTLTSSAAFTVQNVTLSGNTISITAANDITDTATGLIVTSGAGGLTLVTPGNIGVDASNGLGVSVGGSGVLTLGSIGTPIAGNVFITSPAALTVGAVNTTPAVQTIDIRTTSGNLTLSSTITGNDHMVLKAAGGLDNAGTLLTEASLDLQAADGIGTSATFNISAQAVAADNTAAGDIDITNSSATAVTITSLTASSGNISYAQSGSQATFGPVSAGAFVVTLSNAGGAILLNGPVSGVGGVVDISTTGTGDVTVNSPVNGDTVVITAAQNAIVDANVTATATAAVTAGGGITGIGTVGGAVVNLNADTTIGGAPGLNVNAGTLNAIVSGLGANINLKSSGGGTMTLNNVTSPTGSITVAQSGAGNRLRLVSVSAPGGTVTLSTAETINEAANDDAGAHTPEIAAVNVNLQGDSGIGTTSRLDLAASGTVTVNASGGDASIANNGALNLGTSSVGGNLTAIAEAGNFVTSGTVSIGGTGVLTAQAGGATMTIGSALTGGSGNLTLTADGGITLNSTVNGGNVFTATAAGGDVIATADIGGITPPTSVVINGVNIELQRVASGTGNHAYNASGLITLKGDNYRTNGGSISFNGDAVLAAPLIIVDSDISDITFGGTVNGATDLVLAAGPGNITLAGAVGGSTKLSSVTASGNNISLHDVSTTGAQLYTPVGAVTLNGNYTADSGVIKFAGAATLASAVNVNANGGTDGDDIIFTGTITGPGSLTAVAAGSGDVSIDGVGGGATPLASVTIVGDDISLAGMNTVGPQSYTASGILTLGGNYSNAGGAINFAAGSTVLNADVTVNAGGGTDADDVVFTGTITGAHDLSLTAAGAGDVTIGGTVNVSSITATANDIALPNVTTTGVQSYTGSGTITLNGTLYDSSGGAETFAGATLLTGDTVVSTAGGKSITFSGTVDGAFALTANTNDTNGVTTFGGAVGGTTALTSVTTDADGTTRINGGSVTTTGNQTYDDAVTLGADTTLSGTNIKFGLALDGAQALTVITSGSGTTTFGGAVGGTTPLTSLTTNADGSTVINGGGVATSGDQSYGDAVTIGADTTVAGNDINFASTVDGAFALTVNSNTTGTTTFGGAVGGTTALSSLTTNADGTTAINGGAVSTTGVQSYGDGVVLGADTTLSGGSVNFTSTVNSDGTARDLTVNSAGATVFGGAVGGASHLKNLTTNSSGTTAINGGAITTDADQTFNDVVTIGADATLVGHNVTFVQTVDGAFALTVNTTGTGLTKFGGAVGGGTPLASLTTDSDGTTAIDGGAVSTSGDQAYHDNVTVGADTTLIGTNVLFDLAVDSDAVSARDLTVNGSGNTTFNGIVGGAHPLKNLATGGGGTTRINTTAITTTADQTYDDAVSLLSNTNLTGDNIKFTSTVDGAKTLTVDSSVTGKTTFGGAVGATDALVSVTTDSDGETDINGGSVRTTGIQTYNDTVVLGADTIITGTNVTFGKTLNSDSASTNRDLTVNASGITKFNDAVGVAAKLKNLTTDAAGTTQINGAAATNSINTTADQTYNDAVTLLQSTTINGANVNFVAAVDADAAGNNRDLTVNASLLTTFNGPVGNSQKLNKLTTDALGTTLIKGGVVKTNADMTFNDVVQLGGSTTLTGVNVTLAKTVDSFDTTARDLTINDTGTTTLGGAVGSTNPLNSILTDLLGSTHINGGTVKTVGNQTFNDPVVIGADAVFTTTSTSGGGVNFANTLDSLSTVVNGVDVTVNATGTITFAGLVGGVSPLKDLTATTTATTSINAASITTTADQIYAHNVSLGKDSILSGKNFTFGGTLDGAHALTVNSTGGGLIQFIGAVGSASGQALTSLTTTGTGNVEISGGSVKTTGIQSFGNDVILKANSTFTGGNISFTKKLDSDTTPRNLTVTSTGNVSITGAAGTSKLATVSMTATNVDIHSVQSTGAQTYTVTTLATINGHYDLDNGAFKVSGNTMLGGGSFVTTNGTITGSGNNSITFTGTIDGNHTLNLAASGAADVFLQKAVGGSSALGGLSVAGEHIEVVSVRTKKTGSDSDHTGAISLKVDGGDTADTAFDQDSQGHAAQAFRPDGTIKITGDIVSAGGDVVLGTTTARSTTNILTFPSIIVDPATAGGTVTISGHDITMGRNEKLVVNGSVKIVGTGEVKLSDITALDSIDVTGAPILVQTRNPGTVLDSKGKTLLHDVNTDFVAGNAIKFHGSSSVESSTDASHRVLFATVGNDVSNLPSGSSVLAITDNDFSIRLGGSATGDFIDLRAQGLSVTNPAAALAGAAPQESRQPEVENAVASSQAIELRNLGIFARDMDRASLVGYLEGIVLYNDVPGRIASGETLPMEQYQVTKNRLSFDGARRVLDLYYSTYFQTDEFGRPIMKNGKRVENITAMNKAIEEAITAYRGKTGQKTGNIDPVAFREYVEITPSQGEALKHMNRLRNLFNEILPVGETNSRKGMGLTPVEAAISRKVLVQSLGVQGMGPEELEKSILAHPAHVAAAKAQAAPQAKPQPKPQPQAQPQPKPQAQPAPQPQAQPTPQAQPKPAPQPTAQPRPTVRPGAKPTFTPNNDSVTEPAK